MDFINEAATSSFLGSRATTPTAHVGSLPLTTFVYILTGAFVGLICFVPFVKFITSFGTRFSYHAIASHEEKDRTTNFRQPRVRGPIYLESVARTAVERNPLQPTNYVTPPVRNLPLPIGDAFALQPDTVVELVSMEDLYDVQEFLAEKKKLDITIHNLKRVVGVSQQAANPAVMRRLQDATQKKGQLVASIDQTVGKLREHRASWTDEEWSLISLILEAYGRRI